jgi:hypothetical protein
MVLAEWPKNLRRSYRFSGAMSCRRREKKGANSLGTNFDEGVEAALIDCTFIRIYDPKIMKPARQAWVSRKTAFCVNVLVTAVSRREFYEHHWNNTCLWW